MTRLLWFCLLLAALSSTLAQTYEGTLEAGDAQLDSGEYLDVFIHPGTAGQTLTIDLSSTEFDPYLVVLDPDDVDILDVDDSAGHGTDVFEMLELTRDGEYTIAVTSATAGEMGSYRLVLSVATSAAPGNPLAPPAAVNPLAKPVADPFVGSFSDGALTVDLQRDGDGYGGSFELGGASYPVRATSAGGELSGTFVSGGQDFAFSARFDGGTLVLETGGTSYRLEPAPAAAPTPPANPLATPTTPTPATPAPVAPAAPAAPPQGRIGAKPGYIVGTAFDTRGEPLAGAGVLIVGTTFEQGQRTSFETTTGADGTYAVRVPDGRYEAKAWIERDFDGYRFSRLLHPLSGSSNTEVDSTEGGVLDFQWRLSGLAADSAPPGSDPTDFYGASIDFSYCGLPADAYCDSRYEAFPTTPIAPGGSTVTVTLTPTGPLLDGSTGAPLSYTFDVAEQDAEYPYGSAPNAPAGYPDGGGGRTTLGADWPYHSTDLNDIPVGRYRMTATVTFPDGRSQPLRLGLSADDVEHEAIEVSFSPWQDYQARSYSGGGLNQRTIYVRD